MNVRQPQKVPIEHEAIMLKHIAGHPEIYAAMKPIPQEMWDRPINFQPAPNQHVSRSDGALYSEPRRSTQRRRCDGHLAEKHFIEEGDMAVWSALPPGGEIGYTTWQHAVFCLECAPIMRIPAGSRSEGETR